MLLLHLILSFTVMASTARDGSVHALWQTFVVLLCGLARCLFQTVVITLSRGFRGQGSGVQEAEGSFRSVHNLVSWAQSTCCSHSVALYDCKMCVCGGGGDKLCIAPQCTAH